MANAENERREKYIIFKDKEMLGYLESEEEARKAVNCVVRRIIAETKQNSTSEVRIFSENIDSGISIYSSSVGTIFNSPLSLIHTISYSSVPIFSLI